MQKFNAPCFLTILKDSGSIYLALFRKFSFMLNNPRLQYSIPIVLILVVVLLSLYPKLLTHYEQSNDFASKVVDASKEYVNETNRLFYEFETNTKINKELINAIRRNVLKIDRYSSRIKGVGLVELESLINQSINSTINEALKGFYYTYESNVSLLKDRLQLDEGPIHVEHKYVDVRIYEKDIANIYWYVNSGHNLQLKTLLDAFSFVPIVGDLYDAGTFVYDPREKYLFLNLKLLINKVLNDYESIIVNHKKNQKSYEDVVQLSIDLFEGW